MITIDLSNHAHMAILSFGLLLTFGISFLGGMVVGNGDHDGVIDNLPFIPLVGMAFCAGSLVVSIGLLIAQSI